MIARIHKRVQSHPRLRAAFRILAVIILLPFILTPVYSIINPPITTVMVFKLFGGAGIHKSWRNLEQISPELVRSVLVAEDGRFCEHDGIDWHEVKNAATERRRNARGASTITMQMVKNLFLWTDRSWARKALEAPLAMYAEIFLSKRRIMEIYLNIVEWDTGIYGAQAAAKHHFGTNANALTTSQSARLAAVLPAPEKRNPSRPGPTMIGHASRIAARAANSGDYVRCVLK